MKLDSVDRVSFISSWKLFAKRLNIMFKYIGRGGEDNFNHENNNRHTGTTATYFVLQTYLQYYYTYIVLRCVWISKRIFSYAETCSSGVWAPMCKASKSYFDIFTVHKTKTTRDYNIIIHHRYCTPDLGDRCSWQKVE